MCLSHQKHQHVKNDCKRDSDAMLNESEIDGRLKSAAGVVSVTQTLMKIFPLCEQNQTQDLHHL